MKKKMICVILLIFSILFIQNVQARECKYTYHGNDITLNFAKDNNEQLNVNYTVENEKHYNKVYNFIDAGLVGSDDKCLKSLNVCNLTEDTIPTFLKVVIASSAAAATVVNPPVGAIILISGVAANSVGNQNYLALFGASLDTLTVDSAYAREFDMNNNEFWASFFLTGRGVKCETVEYSGEKLEKDKFVTYCDKFMSLYSDVANSYREYESCGDVQGTKAEKARCKSKAITEVNKNINVLKNTCNSILSNQSLHVTDGCIESCLNATESIKILRENYMNISSNGNECGFSDNLIVWIKNILNWIKYLLPVAVIILGIIDFIKAIGTDKDDEMKKAQGKFIKRLIAAALTFIIPLIIVFVLEKMGFIVEGCGIIDI